YLSFRGASGRVSGRPKFSRGAGVSGGQGTAAPTRVIFIVSRRRRWRHERLLATLARALLPRPQPNRNPIGDWCGPPSRSSVTHARPATPLAPAEGPERTFTLIR